MLNIFHAFDLFRDLSPHKKRFNRNQGQSVVELAIFGSILMFVVAMIFRQGLNGGNFMNSQLKATRYAMSKSFESSVAAKPGRNTASVMIIEDRLGGDFTNKFSSRDRVPVVATAGGTMTNQLFYPIDNADFDQWVQDKNSDVLPHFDVWINGQRFPFLTANFRYVELPVTKGTLAECGTAHTTDTRCWKSSCTLPGGCLVLYYKVENYHGSDFVRDGNFDLNFDGVDNDVPHNMRDVMPSGGKPMKFMWQWKEFVVDKEIPTEQPLDVDGDFYEERILESVDSNGDQRPDHVKVIDNQAGDLDFSVDGRREGLRYGLLDESQMFSFTKSGTLYQIREGKLYDGRGEKYIRNVNINDHVDIVQRIIQLSNDTGRFCNGNARYDKIVGTGITNPVEACNNCFSGANRQKTCLDLESLKLFVRSRIENKSRRSWFTQTEKNP